MSRRILFFMSSSSPIGGVETWLDRMCMALQKEGDRPIVGLAWGLKTHDPERFQKFHPHLETVRVDGRGLPKSSRVLACARLIRRVRPEFVFPLGLIDAVPACRMAKQKSSSLRVIARTQGLLSPMLADLEDYRDVFDLAVCPGRLNAKYLTDVAGFEASRVRNVPNAADRPVQSRVPRHAGEPLRVAYVGRLTEPDKRATDLPSFYEHLAARGINFQLTIVGDGPCREQIEERLGGRSNVTFTGALPHAEVYERIYLRTDCLISFSSSESFGISIVEAMMNGVVPVTSQFLGLQSEGAVVHGRTGMIFPIGDTAAAAASVAELATDERRLDEISKSASALAEQRYSWESCFKGWKQCLDEVRTMPQSALETSSMESQGASGRLDRLPIPPAISDGVRRLRRAIAPAVRAGGEEWPLFRKTHTRERLAQIAEACERLDQRES